MKKAEAKRKLKKLYSNIGEEIIEILFVYHGYNHNCTTIDPLDFSKMGKFLFEFIGNVNQNKKIQTRQRDSIVAFQKNGSFRGLRQAKGYPSRGQRTRSNAKTSRKVKQIIQKTMKNMRLAR